MSALAPIHLGPNQPPRFYAGGAAIAALRGEGSTDARAPEDWVASTTTLFGEESVGLTILPGGWLLRDAVAADPEGYLGAAHVAAYGGDAALLVKLLDAGERLPVHVHPTRAFAARHLGAHHGKTEAWYVLETAGDSPSVHLGFRDRLPMETVRRWVSAQDTEAMLAAMNRLAVRPGDVVLVPAGTPHAIGAGVFLVELQEPTDFSVMLERSAFGLDDASDLGLGATALDCLDVSAWGPDRLQAVRAHPLAVPGERVRVMPAAADPFFRAELLHGNARLEPAYAVLLVLDGTGTLHTEQGGRLPLSRGETVLVPHGAGAGRLEGDLTAIRALPPTPEDRP